MKKSIFLSALLVCASAIVFAQAEKKPSSPYTQTTKTTPATMSGKSNTVDPGTAATPATTSTKSTKSNAWAKPSPKKAGAAQATSTPESMTAPGKKPSGGGAKPANGTGWNAGKPNGPAAKSLKATETHKTTLPTKNNAYTTEAVMTFHNNWPLDFL